MREYGLIGYPLSHSFSKKYFTEKFEKENISNSSFENFSIERIEHLNVILKEHELLQGLAVTIPYKKMVIPYLHETSEAVKIMNACNCIKIRDGKLFGYNTDVIGFEQSLVKQLQKNHTKALILGTGGGAAAVEYVLQKLNIHYCFVSRKKNKAMNILCYNDVSNEIINTHTLIINTTPLGMYPAVDVAPQIPYHLLSPSHYLFDLIYNPTKTKFLTLGESNGATIKNGYEMLVIQAEENWKAWNE